MKELASARISWSETQKATQNQPSWRNSVKALCITWLEKDKWQCWWWWHFWEDAVILHVLLKFLPDKRFWVFCLLSFFFRSRYGCLSSRIWTLQLHFWKALFYILWWGTAQICSGRTKYICRHYLDPAF